MPNVIAVPTACPKCGGKLWDNRSTPEKPKKNPKAPDFKCRDKSCDGVIWPPRNGEVYADLATAPAPSYNTVGDLPGMPASEQAADEQAFADGIATNDRRLTVLRALFALHDDCVAHAVSVARQHQLPLETVPAMAATTFIAAKDKGLAA